MIYIYLLTFAYVFALTAVLVSFIVCWDYRRKLKISIVTVVSSHCDNCDIKLNTIQLIPVLGTLFYKGKCPNCNYEYSKVSFYHELIIPTLTATIAVLLLPNLWLIGTAIIASLVITKFSLKFIVPKLTKKQTAEAR